MDMNKLLRTHTLGLVIRKFRPLLIEGAERLPSRGPYIMVFGPHKTKLQSAEIAAALPGVDMRYYVKESYTKRWHPFALVVRFSGQIPINRLAPNAQKVAIERGATLLVEGKVVSIYPEGGTYPDDHELHPFGGGAVQTALLAERTLDQFVPIFPCGLLNFLPSFEDKEAELEPRTLRIGEALYTSRFRPSRPMLSDSAKDAQTRRSMTEALRLAIQELSETKLSHFKKEFAEG